MKPKDMGAVVRARRGELEMTMAVLAAKVGITQAQISRLECGQHGFRSHTLVKIAKALRIPPFRLFMTDSEWKRWTKRR